MAFFAGFAGGFGLALAALFVAHVAATVGVARDAKDRGMDGAVVWMMLTLFVPFLALLLYVLIRPGGAMAFCPSCRGARLRASTLCPHCNHGWEPAAGEQRERVALFAYPERRTTGEEDER